MKMLDRGYWISLHFVWQSLFYVFINAIRFRSFTFYSACNPAISLGGMFFDRKTDLYKLVPSDKLPATAILTTFQSAIDFMGAYNLSFPIIVKPNVGFKGFKVFLLRKEEELDAFLKTNDINEREWIIQEFLSYEREFSILFYKYPISKSFGISSFVEKGYPFVTGDGKSTLQQLIKNNSNPFLLREAVLKNFSKDLGRTPEQGKRIVLDVIGNYSRGSKFYSLMTEVDDALISSIANSYQNLAGLNFFRIDLKSNSILDIKIGHYKIIEINGMKSEPIHIYDSESSFLKNYRTIKKHWDIIVGITKEQRAKDVVLPTFKEGFKSLRSIKKLVK